MGERISFFINARMLIIKDKKIFIGYEPKRFGRGGNHWETPGGGVKAGENIIVALKREAKEEIGARIEVIERLPFFFNFKGEELNKNFKGSHGFVIYFICNLMSKPDLKKAKQKEFSELKFMGKNEFSKLAKENKVMFFDKWFLPKIMKKLKLW